MFLMSKRAKRRFWLAILRNELSGTLPELLFAHGIRDVAG